MTFETKIALSIDEASLIAGIGKTRLYQAINQKHLKAKKMGRKTLILNKDLEAFLLNLEDYPTENKEV